MFKDIAKISAGLVNHYIKKMCNQYSGLLTKNTKFYYRFERTSQFQKLGLQVFSKFLDPHIDENLSSINYIEILGKIYLH